MLHSSKNNQLHWVTSKRLGNRYSWKDLGVIMCHKLAMSQGKCVLGFQKMNVTKRSMMWSVYEVWNTMSSFRYCMLRNMWVRKSVDKRKQYRSTYNKLHCFLDLSTVWRSSLVAVLWSYAVLPTRSTGLIMKWCQILMYYSTRALFRSRIWKLCLYKA